jgi:hypothetical protein
VSKNLKTLRAPRCAEAAECCTQSLPPIGRVAGRNGPPRVRAKTARLAGWARRAAGAGDHRQDRPTKTPPTKAMRCFDWPVLSMVTGRPFRPATRPTARAHASGMLGVLRASSAISASKGLGQRKAPYNG